MSSRTLNILVALDRLVFCLVTFGKSSPNETISAAAYSCEQKGLFVGKFFRPIIDALFFFDPFHCHNQYVYEKTNYTHYN